MTNGWLLNDDDRETLLRDHPPRYAKVVAHHVTLDVKASDPPREVKAAVLGSTDDEQGVEALVVSIDGSVDRPDGSIYHITWSLGEGRAAKESNDVLKQRGWTEWDHPVPITLTPSRLR
jgi:hypothetical protein